MALFWITIYLAMNEPLSSRGIVRFGVFEVDLASEELRKNGLKIRLSGQPFQVLAMLLERPGQVVSREELQAKLWPEGTFVDFDHSLNTAINKIREALGDSAENPRFVETLARRGYRFIAPVESTSLSARDLHTRQTTAQEGGAPAVGDMHQRKRWRLWTAVAAASALAIMAAVMAYQKLKPLPPAPQRALTRLTFDAGLQFGATWSPDGRFIAYSSDRGGKFDIWVQPVSGGDAVRVTKGSGHNWQPDWSPDGKQIAFRSERSDGGLYVVPALGGPERKIASFGYSPRWSPDSSELLFQTNLHLLEVISPHFYVAALDGSPPREVLADFFGQHNLHARSAAWHPDGKLISVWVRESRLIPTLWTMPVDGGTGVELESAPEVVKQVRNVGSGGRLFDLAFCWAPSGQAIYFERTFGGAKNVWKMAVEPNPLRATSFERLTTGAGPDTDFALSRDGKRLAFTAKTQHTRIWLFPFNATSGLVTGKGQAVTSPGMVAWRQSLSPDGRKLAFSVQRSGKHELWERSLVDGSEVQLAADDCVRLHAQWSPEGRHLAYARVKSQQSQVVIWSAESRTEEPLTPWSTTFDRPHGWSPDGKQLLVSRGNSDVDGAVSIWLMPTGPGLHAAAEAGQVVADPTYNLYQGHFSPDRRWIVFEEVKNNPIGQESTLYVVAESGGPWIRITDGKSWDDKPRWSPDGKTIYFVSGRSGFFNVWGIRFDPTQRGPVGEPFQVTRFDSPELMILDQITLAELSLTQDWLTLTMTDASGSIWMLDNVDR